MQCLKRTERIKSSLDNKIFSDQCFLYLLIHHSPVSSNKVFINIITLEQCGQSSQLPPITAASLSDGTTAEPRKNICKCTDEDLHLIEQANGGQSSCLKGGKVQCPAFCESRKLHFCLNELSPKAFHILQAKKVNDSWWRSQTSLLRLLTQSLFSSGRWMKLYPSVYSSLSHTLSIWIAARFMTMGGVVILSHYYMDESFIIFWEKESYWNWNKHTIYTQKNLVYKSQK